MTKNLPRRRKILNFGNLPFKIVATCLCLSFGVYFLISDSAFSRSKNSDFLKMPYDVFAIKDIKEDNVGFTCKNAPQPIVDLALPAYYDQTDESRSKIKQDVYEEHQELRQPVRDYNNYLIYMTNRYVEGGMKREDVATCAVNWLYVWASANAMLGEMNRTGAQIQKWSLATYANAYYQIFHSPSMTNDQKKIIEKWLFNYAVKVKENYSTDTHRQSRNNNHLYWAAWGVGVTGAVLQERSLYEWGIDRARFGVNLIEKKGVLPLEMDRAERALNYHVFAAHPLVMMAELSRINKDVDLYRENKRALETLVETSIKGLINPTFFENRTGEKQKMNNVKNNSALAWIEVYAKTHKYNHIDKLLKEYRPMKQTRTGGNITMLYSGTEKKVLKKPFFFKFND